MMQVWDSADMIAKQQIELYPDTFNANSKPDKPSEEAPRDLMDKRSTKHVSTSTISCPNCRTSSPLQPGGGRPILEVTRM